VELLRPFPIGRRVIPVTGQAPRRRTHFGNTIAQLPRCLFCRRQFEPTAVPFLGRLDEIEANREVSYGFAVMLHGLDCADENDDKLIWPPCWALMLKSRYSSAFGKCGRESSQELPLEKELCHFIRGLS
jgi:hypothetical protein